MIPPSWDRPDIQEGGACGLPPVAEGEPGLVLARRGDRLFAYLNACPHLGVTLDNGSGRFLDAGGAHILCAAHGALFRIEDGLCLHGPCLGERLVGVPVPPAWGAAPEEGDARDGLW